MLLVYVLFFVKQKQSDEMRISDWSSDVCSSDLHVPTQRSGGARTAPLGASWWSQDPPPAEPVAGHHLGGLAVELEAHGVAHRERADREVGEEALEGAGQAFANSGAVGGHDDRLGQLLDGVDAGLRGGAVLDLAGLVAVRSEARRLGKVGVRRVRNWW